MIELLAELVFLVAMSPLVVLGIVGVLIGVLKVA